MKMDELQNAIELLDDELINEVGQARMNAGRPNRMIFFMKYASVAACVCLVLIGSFIALTTMSSRNNGPETEMFPENITESDMADNNTSHLQEEEVSGEIENGNTNDDNFKNTENENELIATIPPTADKDESNPNIERFPEGNKSTVNLSAGILSAESGTDFETCDPIKYSVAFSDYALKLFREVHTGKGNEMLSPLSVSYALGIAANGANGETLTQIEKLLGMSKDEFNTFLRCYMNSLPNGEKYSFSAANSVWLRNTFCNNVSKSYLKALINHYSADVYTSPFDRETVNKVNGWVNNKTDGMINEIVDDLSGKDMILINALCFDAEWEDQFEAYKNTHSDFTSSDKSKVNVEYMNGTLSNEHKNYIEDENASGFIKYYKDNKYAFVALLPNEGISIDEYVNELTGEKLNSLIRNSVKQEVKISIPKFKSTYENRLDNSLINLGVQYAFSPEMADFSEMSKFQSLYISNVIHKTYFEMNEVGSKAGAVTKVEIYRGVETINKDAKEVYLNRPFVYMVIDCENSIPMFFGTVTDPTK